MKMNSMITSCATAIFCLAQFHPASAQSWSQTSAPTNAWTAVASSTDGSHLVAVGGHFIYTSTDYGSTWVSNNAPAVNWTSVASSADGTKLVAAAGAIYTNSGTTWTLAFASTHSGRDQDISFVASSADGAKLVAASSFGDPINSPKPLVYVSADSGASWAIVTNAPSDGAGWLSVASSADGTKLAASMMTGGIFTSANSGTTWSSNTVAPFFSLAMSADGNNLAGAGLIGLFYSSNAGATWAPLLNGPAITNRVACSTNGLVLFGLGKTDIYSSVNGGSTWVTNIAPASNWMAIAVSQDGSRGVAAVAGGGIYILSQTSIIPPTLFITNSPTAVSVFWSTNFTAAQSGLAQNTNLAGTNWIPVPNTPVVNGALYEVSLPETNSREFFRLQPP